MPWKKWSTERRQSRKSFHICRNNWKQKVFLSLLTEDIFHVDMRFRACRKSMHVLTVTAEHKALDNGWLSHGDVVRFLRFKAKNRDSTDLRHAERSRQVRGFCTRIWNQSGSCRMKTECLFLESGEILPEVTVIRDSVSGCLRMSAGKAWILGGNTDLYSP